MSEAAIAGSDTAIRPFRIDVGQQELDRPRAVALPRRVGPPGSWSQIRRREDGTRSRCSNSSTRRGTSSAAETRCVSRLIGGSTGFGAGNRAAMSVSVSAQEE